MEKHITLAAALNIGLNALGILMAFFLFVLLVGIGIVSGEEEAMAVLSTVGTITAFFLVITSIPGLIGGIGLLKRRSWARILLLVVSVIELLNLPFGTALGIYTIWVLIHDDTKRILDSAEAKALDAAAARSSWGDGSG
jgi:hypothetical protein